MKYWTLLLALVPFVAGAQPPTADEQPTIVTIWGEGHVLGIWNGSSYDDCTTSMDENDVCEAWVWDSMGGAGIKARMTYLEPVDNESWYYDNVCKYRMAFDVNWDSGYTHYEQGGSPNNLAIYDDFEQVGNKERGWGLVETDPISTSNSMGEAVPPNADFYFVPFKELEKIEPQYTPVDLYRPGVGVRILELTKGQGINCIAYNEETTEIKDEPWLNPYVQGLNSLAVWIFSDPDRDGVDSRIDNCIDTDNTSQVDTDNDSYGDACQFPSICDVTGDGKVGVPDYGVMLSEWGNQCPPDESCAADCTEDGIVGVDDYGKLIADWGFVARSGPACGGDDPCVGGE